MPLQQEDLPRLSRDYYNVAESIAGRALSQYDLHIADINQDGYGRIRWTQASEDESLPGLAVLALLLQRVDTLRTHNPDYSRNNVVTAARIGSFAARQTYEIAAERSHQLSTAALGGINSAFGAIQSRMEATFLPIARPYTSDRHATFFLASAARILNQE